MSKFYIIDGMQPIQLPHLKMYCGKSECTCELCMLSRSYMAVAIAAN